MRRIVLLVPAILLAAACSSGKSAPTVDGIVPAGKPATSPSAASSASAPKTPSPNFKAGSWCAHHPASQWCQSPLPSDITEPVPSGPEIEAARLKGFAFRRVTLYPDRVEIRRVIRRIVIPASDIVEVRAGAPSLLTHAYLWFVVPGEEHGYVSDRHVIMFNAWRPGHRRTWRRLVEVLGQ